MSCLHTVPLPVLSLIRTQVEQLHNKYEWEPRQGARTPDSPDNEDILTVIRVGLNLERRVQMGTQVFGMGAWSPEKVCARACINQEQGGGVGTVRPGEADIRQSRLRSRTRGRWFDTHAYHSCSPAERARVMAMTLTRKYARQDTR